MNLAVLSSASASASATLGVQHTVLQLNGDKIANEDNQKKVKKVSSEGRVGQQEGQRSSDLICSDQMSWRGCRRSIYGGGRFTKINSPTIGL